MYNLMKKGIIAAILLMMISQAVFAQSKTIITELITYRVNLKLDEHIESSSFTDPRVVYELMNGLWYENKLAPNSYQALVTQIHKAASSGQIKVYELSEIIGTKPIFMKMPISEIQGIGMDTIQKRQQRPFPPYEEYDTTIVRNFSFQDIVQIEFMEKWTMNTQTMKIKKEIIAFALCRKRIDLWGKEYRGTSKMYWIKCQ